MIEINFVPYSFINISVTVVPPVFGICVNANIYFDDLRQDKIKDNSTEFFQGIVFAEKEFLDDKLYKK